MRQRRAWAACGLAVVVLTTAACTGDGLDPGPVVTTETAYDDTRRPPIRAKCVSADSEGEVVVHPGSMTALTPILLLDLVLRDHANVVIVESLVIPYQGPTDLSGVVADYPPSESAELADSLADWEDREPLAGHLLRPGEGQVAVMVAVRLEDPERPGRLDGVAVETVTDGDRQWHQLDLPVLVVPHGELCSVDAVADTTAWAG